MITTDITKANKTRPNNKRGGFRGKTPKNLSGVDRITWLSKEINIINDTNRLIEKLYDQYDQGSLDRREAFVALVLANRSLVNYACTCLEQMQEEERRQAEERKGRKRNIIPFPCRNLQGNSL